MYPHVLISTYRIPLFPKQCPSLTVDLARLGVQFSLQFSQFHEEILCFIFCNFSPVATGDNDSLLGRI